MKNKKQEKQLRERINFSRIVSLFLLGFYAYIIIMFVILVTIDPVFSFQDFILSVFPLPIFLILIILLLYKDDQIVRDNEEVQRELDLIKGSHNARKRAEEELDK